MILLMLVSSLRLPPHVADALQFVNMGLEWVASGLETGLSLSGRSFFHLHIAASASFITVFVDCNYCVPQ